MRDGGRIEACRAVFGDESLDYQEALQRHYQNGAPADWQDDFVSAYATMHPWEDFAETWTHYLHMVDTLDTAASFGLAVDPTVTDDRRLSTEVDASIPTGRANFDRLVEAWMPLTVAVNSLNRSMGQPDLYPFALTPAGRSRSCASSTSWCRGGRPLQRLGAASRARARARSRVTRSGGAMAARTSATGSDITNAPTGSQAKGTPLCLQADDEARVALGPVALDQAAEVPKR